MTRMQRRAEQIAKLKKRKDPVAKKILKGMLKPSKSNAKQKVYAARHAAKLRGETPPPLPSEAQAAA